MKALVALLLAAALGAPVIQTDDFASWDNPLDWWPAFLEQVLEPLAAGAPARFRPSSWGGPERDPVEIRPGPFVVVEGVTASRAAFRPYLAFAIWVDAPRDVRLARGVARDGEQMRARWEEWMAAEDDWVERERPAEHADVVLAGGVW